MKRTHLKPLFIAAALVLSGCVAVPLEQPIAGYSCCNLHPEYGWVSSDNLLGLPILPAGEPAQIGTIKKNYYLYGSVGDQDLGFRDDTSKGKEGTIRWARKLIVSEDPKQQLATWSTEVQFAVRAGKIMVGMTRPQVLMSLGYPPSDGPSGPNSEVWRYRTYNEDEAVDVNFDNAGTVVALTGKASAVRVVEFPR